MHRISWTDRIASVLVAWLLICRVAAADQVFDLQPKEVADGVFVLEGELEHFSFRNRGNIVNTGFIVGDDGVIVIDTGPSRLYGEAMRQVIAETTDKPVATVLITHLHPDHFLGNQAFSDVPILALPGTVKGIEEQGELFNDAMYRMVGTWMKGTEVRVPAALGSESRIVVAGRELELLNLAGHSGADLAVFDQKSGVLFAGDLVFYQRTPTTPQANVSRWLDDLAVLHKVPFRVLVPGHGPTVNDRRGIEQTALYLDWLTTNLRGLAESGVSMAEALEPAPSGAAFFSIPVFLEEYQRSVAHLFPAMERESISRGLVVQQADE
ncbi:MAG: quinoprotein relay system zinc metallohydrolase 1 [Pseudomonadota bacterium]